MQSSMTPNDQNDRNMGAMAVNNEIMDISKVLLHGFKKDRNNYFVST